MNVAVCFMSVLRAGCCCVNKCVVVAVTATLLAPLYEIHMIFTWEVLVSLHAESTRTRKHMTDPRSELYRGGRTNSASI